MWLVVLSATSRLCMLASYSLPSRAPSLSSLDHSSFSTFTRPIEPPTSLISTAGKPQSSPRACPQRAPCLLTTLRLYLSPFVSALDIMVRRRPQQHSPCTCGVGDDGRRCLLRRNRRNGTFGGRARRWQSRRSSCICLICTPQSAFSRNKGTK